MNSVRWDKHGLYELVRSKLGDRLFVVVSNREPYVHVLAGEKIEWQQPVSGLTEALDPVMRASGGIWVAQGTGSADRRVVDEHDRVAVPPDNPEYTLRRVWLTDEEVNGFYLGFANSALWPLCHITYTAPVFREEDWHAYQKVNQIFADAVVAEIGGREAVVLVQDYHFALLSRYLKEKNPHLTVGQFWHIPWPPYEVFRTCPWRREILEGMLGNDLMGFHVNSFCCNFISAAARETDIKTDERKMVVPHNGGTTFVEPFPISVDFDAINEQAGTESVNQEMEALRREYHLDNRFIGLGMDRLDYTKGIPEKLRAFGKFLHEYPEYQGKIVFIEAGMPSRTDIEAYRDIDRQINDLVTTINTRFGDGDYLPVIEMKKQLSHETLLALRRIAHFCVVGSLEDGMNLVAKEYVAARSDGDGVLILSEFTGAAEELTDALLVNPYDTTGFAWNIRQAVEMPEPERRERMGKMRRTVAENNIYRWGASMVTRLMEIAKD